MERIVPPLAFRQLATGLFGDFAVVRADRPRGRGGGLVTLIHHSLSFTLVDTSLLSAADATLEVLAINVKFKILKNAI